MLFPFQVHPATFIKRPNRFHVVARLQETGETENIVSAHCPNPGRLGELLVPGATLYLSKATTTTRKTTHDLRIVAHPQTGQLISLDTRLPNKLFAEGLEQNFFEPFRGTQSWQHEVASDIAKPDAKVHSRFDFRLVDRQGHSCWVEVKSVSLVEDRIALFPDAPTERGRRHVEELMQVVEEGGRAAVVFIVQREDADCVKPKMATDPAFAAALSDAKAAGVELYAYTCRMTLTEATLAERIPVSLEDH